ncbi:MAG: ribonuclease E/G [Phascolarctobacterium sp.]
MRLRDIGGIIVVDFIDMHTDSHKKEILNVLHQAMNGDKMHPKVQDITVLNLVEITRKNHVKIFPVCCIHHVLYAMVAEYRAGKLYPWRLRGVCVPC